MLSKEQILAANDRPTEEVDMRPFWPGTVRVRALGCNQKDALDAELEKQGANGNGKHLRRAILLHCLVDEQGNQLFTTPEEAALLGEKSPQAADRIIDAAARLSFPDDTAAPVEEIAKNS